MATVTTTRIGARFRSIRERAGLTQEEMADRLGLSQPQISRLENGRAWNSFAAIVDALTDAGFDPVLLVQEVSLLTPEEKVLLDELRRLGPGRRAALLEFLRS